MRAHAVSFLRAKIASRPFSDPLIWRLNGLSGQEQGRVAIARELVWRSKFSSSRSQAPGLKPTLGT